jgi:23S rRNA (adenine2030-N6)-methyltransferase
MRIIEYLKRKDKPFRVFDTHAGKGLYRLDSPEALKTDEWALGVKKVLNSNPPENVETLIAPWRQVVEACGKSSYPGSPRLAHALLRPTDRLSLYEQHPEDFAVLKAAFSDDYQTRIIEGDGWLVSVSPIPPKEGRGVILVDPPFEDGKDFDQMINLLQNSSQRWAGGVVALWYPVKRRDHTDEWLGTLKGLKFRNLLNVELYIRDPRPADMLNGCGMVILNPPYTLRQELETLMPWLSQTLGQDKGWGHRIQDLSGR